MTQRTAREKPAWAMWLQRHYIQWQLDLGERRSTAALAEWLCTAGGKQAELSRSALTRLMNGNRRPSLEVAYLLADAFKDTSLFEALGQRAPTLLECQLYVAMRWRTLPPRILKQLEAALEEAEAGGSQSAAAESRSDLGLASQLQ